MKLKFLCDVKIGLILAGLLLTSACSGSDGSTPAAATGEPFVENFSYPDNTTMTETGNWVVLPEPVAKGNK